MDFSQGKCINIQRRTRGPHSLGEGQIRSIFPIYGVIKDLNFRPRLVRGREAAGTETGDQGDGRGEDPWDLEPSEAFCPLAPKHSGVYVEVVLGFAEFHSKTLQ